MLSLPEQDHRRKVRSCPSAWRRVKPGRNLSKTCDTDGSPYQPDFVDETDTATVNIKTRVNNRNRPTLAAF